MSTTREITKQGRDGTSVRLLLRSTDPFQPRSMPVRTTTGQAIVMEWSVCGEH
jgi:hypothetical protein